MHFWNLKDIVLKHVNVEQQSKPVVHFGGVVKLLGAYIDIVTFGKLFDPGTCVTLPRGTLAGITRAGSLQTLTSAILCRLS